MMLNVQEKILFTNARRDRSYRTNQVYVIDDDVQIRRSLHLCFRLRAT
jgi:hypothetical protein